ncbi:MAG: helix-turn-helix domain-containing protein [Gammaproteobacteria bacterium]
MTIARLPIPVLRPFVAQVWASDELPAVPSLRPETEHLLPTGMMHLAFRMVDAPLRVRESPTDAGALLRGAMVGGARSRYFIRELSAPGCSVAAVLRPGAAQLLFGAGADELAGRHTPLPDLWGAAADSLRERLLETPSAEARLALLEAALAARLPRVRGLHPAIAAVLHRMDAALPVAAAVEDSGLSHRRFIAQFRSAVGLAPKAYLRVQRFQQALRRLRRGAALASVAADAGYSDQSHFSREFLEFSGVTPAAYRRLQPAQANHLLVAAGQISSRRTRAGDG